MRSGYNQRLEDFQEIGRFQAWTNYVTLVSINGGTPAGFDEWMKPETNSASEEQSADGSVKKRSESQIKKARKISAKKKAALEAAMNAIP